MRITLPNIAHAVRHPIAAFRYFRNRDVIPYRIIAGSLPPDPVIVEAGAANGQNTLEMASFWPGSIIHAFEPVLAAREAAEGRTAQWRERVFIYPLALGNKPGVFEMHISGSGASDDSQSSSLLKPSGHAEEFGFVKFEKSESVTVTTLDDWAREHGVNRVDFLWLDMQGFELRALEGGSTILDTVSAIHMEVSRVPLYADAPLYPEILRFMKKKGFEIRYEAVFRIGGNVLFTRKSG